MMSDSMSHENLIISEEESAIRGVVRVAELAIGRYHVKTMKAREADAMESRRTVSVSRMRLRIKPYEDTRTY